MSIGEYRRDKGTHEKRHEQTALESLAYSDLTLRSDMQECRGRKGSDNCVVVLSTASQKALKWTRSYQN